MLPPKPFTRWSRDTETAFLLALKLTGRVRDAAEAIGRSVATAYTRRARYPDFAERWAVAVVEAQSRWTDAQQPACPDNAAMGRERLDGWTPVRRRAFLRALSETGNVRIACERVRISTTAAARLRRDQPAFAAQWDAALDRAAPMLEQIAWERAVEGWDEPIVVNGAIVGQRRRYSENLLRTLMLQSARRDGATTRPKGPQELRQAAHDAARAAGGIFSDRATEAQTDARLIKQLDGLAKRLRMEEARANEEAGARNENAAGVSADGFSRTDRAGVQAKRMRT